MKYYNGSEWKSEDLASPTKDGLMPKEDKATLDGVTAYGKDLLKSDHSLSARTKLGLGTGATAAGGFESDLTTGTDTTYKVWGPKTIADYVKAGDTTNLSDAKTYTDTTIEALKIPKLDINPSDFIEDPYYDKPELWTHASSSTPAGATLEFTGEVTMPNHKNSYMFKQGPTPTPETMYSPYIRRYAQKPLEKYLFEYWIYIGAGSIDTLSNIHMRAYNYLNPTGGSTSPNNLLSEYDPATLPREKWIKLTGVHTAPTNGNNYLFSRLAFYRTADTPAGDNEATIYIGKSSIIPLDTTTKNKTVNALDYGAVGNGVVDDRPGIEAAIGEGGRKVIIPAGNYQIGDSILLQDDTHIAGAGIDVTYIQAMDTMPNASQGFVNADRPNGNTNISISNLTYNGMFDIRSVKSGSTSAGGGSRGSGITFGNVTKGSIHRVRSLNNFLHGIDITCASVNYPYDGDSMPEAPGPSQHIWISECITEGFGDDGITTHHSQYIHITNCYSHSPRNRDNNNGIEVDDGSRFVTLNDNTTRGCYGGVEIKAHDNAPAPHNITINGHMSIEDCRSYNWRHIGHHAGSDPISPTAYDIDATNLISIRPNNNNGFQDEATPKALSVSAFRNVTINGFQAVGDLNDPIGSSIVSLQYRSNNISISGMSLRDFTGADPAIYLGASTRYITFTGISVENCGPVGIYSASSDSSTEVVGGIFRATGGTTGIELNATQSQESGVDVSGTRFIGYTTDIKENGTDYTAKEHTKMRLQLILA